jgi:hypothetical protein
MNRRLAIGLFGFLCLPVSIGAGPAAAKAPACPECGATKTFTFKTTDKYDVTTFRFWLCAHKDSQGQWVSRSAAPPVIVSITVRPGPNPRAGEYGIISAELPALDPPADQYRTANVFLVAGLSRVFAQEMAKKYQQKSYILNGDLYYVTTC